MRCYYLKTSFSVGLLCFFRGIWESCAGAGSRCWVRILQHGLRKTAEVELGTLILQVLTSPWSEDLPTCPSEPYLCLIGGKIEGNLSRLEISPRAASHHLFHLRSGLLTQHSVWRLPML